MVTLQKTIRNRISDLDSVRELVSALEHACQLHACPLPEKVVFDINVVFDELLSNIIKYGYDDGALHEIHVALSASAAVIEIRIEDDGKAFDPLSLPEPDVSLPLAERPVGGLGIHFVRQLMDRVEYKRENNHNYLFLNKYL